MDESPSAPAPAPRTFRYLRDPVFLAAVALYLVNRFAIKPFTGDTNDVWHCYVNDLLCVPFWLPPILRLLRACGLREHDAIPTIGELALLVVLWSWLFEFAVPGSDLRFEFPNAVGDPLDVAAYALGACIGGLLWRSGRAPRGRCVADLGGNASAPRQHLVCAAGIVVGTIAAAVLPTLVEQVQVLKSEARFWLEHIAIRVDEHRQRAGHLPASLAELGSPDPRWRVEQIDYRVADDTFVLVDLGVDRSPGGIGAASDVWWPAERQPPADLVACAWSRDTANLAAAGSLAGCAIAALWLVLRWCAVPRFPRMHWRDGPRAAARVAVPIAVGVLLLYVQTGVLHTPSSH